MKLLVWCFGVALALPFSISGASAATDQTLFEVLSTSTNHSSLIQLLNFAGLSPYLNNATLSSTLFAPTDTDFNLLQFPQRYYIMSDFWYLHLLALLSYHIVPEMLDLSQILSMDQLPTLAPGVTIPVEKTNTKIDNGAAIVISDITASNGLIQVPDRVLMPSVLNMTVADMFFNNATNGSSVEQSFANNFSIFKQIFEVAETSADVTQTLSFNNFLTGLTLFAPPDSAFANIETTTINLLLNRSTLAYLFILNHITDINFYALPPPPNPLGFYMASGLSAWFSSAGEYQSRVNIANITDSILVGNGVINVINQVLLPPLTGYLLSITTYVGAYNFSIFLDMAHGPANLTAVFYSRSPLTLFAPLNSAFSTAQQNVLSRLEQPVWERHLRNLIFHHFTVGSLKSSIFSTSHPTSLPMLSGYNTTVQGDPDGNVTVDDARSVVTDLTAFNGVIYGINEVLLPPSVVDPIFYQLEQMDGFSTLLSLIGSTNLTDLLNNTEGPLTLLAPDDAAFTTVGNLSSYSLSSIQTILMGHIFEGNIFGDDLPDSQISPRWNVSLQSSNISVNGGSIITGDLLASNGVIQVVNRVLISATDTGTTSPTSSPVVAPIATASPVALPNVVAAASNANNGIAKQRFACVCGISIFWVGLQIATF